MGTEKEPSVNGKAIFKQGKKIRFYGLATDLTDEPCLKLKTTPSLYSYKTPF